jgi:hypothetical protein
MATVTFFYEACPICGRPLRIDVRYLGRWMLCSHCEGQFVAGQRQFARPSTVSPNAVAPPSGAFTSPTAATTQPTSGDRG